MSSGQAVLSNSSGLSKFSGFLNTVGGTWTHQYMCVGWVVIIVQSTTSLFLCQVTVHYWVTNAHEDGSTPSNRFEIMCSKIINSYQMILATMNNLLYIN